MLTIWLNPIFILLFKFLFKITIYIIYNRACESMTEAIYSSKPTTSHLDILPWNRHLFTNSIYLAFHQKNLYIWPLIHLI